MQPATWLSDKIFDSILKPFQIKISGHSQYYLLGTWGRVGVRLYKLVKGFVIKWQ